MGRSDLLGSNLGNAGIDMPVPMRLAPILKWFTDCHLCSQWSGAR